MAADVRDALRFGSRDNIHRYRRLLKTHLTMTEREFIERRMAEEKNALLNQEPFSAAAQNAVANVG